MGDAKSGPVVLERYRLVRQLGEGGMGAVYEARHIHLDSRHAVKALRFAGSLPPDQLKQLEARFLREAKICVSVRHPNLVPVTDFGTTDGVPYIVMDFIDGTDLQHVLDERGKFSEQEALQIVRDVASALGALHENGIVHRDMKPANVMIERATGRVILTDLGIAKDVSSSVQLTQGIMGTPAFMAPEQMMDTASAGPDSDVYALGATLYNLLTGRPPFEGESALTILQAAQQNLFAFGSLAGVAKNRDGLNFSPEVESLLHDMTRYDRKERIQSMKEVVNRITRILSGGSLPVPSSDQLTVAFGVESLSQGQPTMRKPSTSTRPPTHAAEKKQPAAPAAPAPAQGQSRPTTRTVLSALSGERTQRGGGKGLVAVGVLLLLAGAGIGGYFAWQKGLLGSPTAQPPQTQTPAPQRQETLEPSRRSTPEPQQQTAQTKVEEQKPPQPAPATQERRFLEVASAPKRLAIPIEGAKAMEFVLVPPGRFTVGTPDGDNEAEKPARQVEFTRPFYIGLCEVTVGQYAAFLNARPPRDSALAGMNLEEMGIIRSEDGRFSAREGASELPARYISHVMARRFCEWLSESAQVEAELPGEIEWEYAARGPESRIYPWGNDWEEGLACAGGAEGPKPVGSFPDGRSWCGALDMVGNVFEWTADEYLKDRYKALPACDPPVAGAGSSSGFRTIRGGCFGNDDYVCRSAHRMGMKGSASEKALGFRVKLLATDAVLKYAGQSESEKR